MVESGPRTTRTYSQGKKCLQMFMQDSTFLSWCLSFSNLREDENMKRGDQEEGSEWGPGIR